MYTLQDGPKVVALTIDDGPSPVYTPQILRILRQYGIIASFSMIGRNAAAFPGVAREVAAAGHMIVNHTWNHYNLGYMPAVAVQDEISQGKPVSDRDGAEDLAAPATRQGLPVHHPVSHDGASRPGTGQGPGVRWSAQSAAPDIKANGPLSLITRWPSLRPSPIRGFWATLRDGNESFWALCGLCWRY